MLRRMQVDADSMSAIGRELCEAMEIDVSSVYSICNVSNDQK
jgi:hypothetical protein